MKNTGDIYLGTWMNTSNTVIFLHTEIFDGNIYFFTSLYTVLDFVVLLKNKNVTS